MNKTFLSIIVAGLTLTSFTGCKTTSNPNGTIVFNGQVVDPAAIGVTARIVSKLGTMATISAQPTDRQYFIIAANVINAAIASTNYNPATIEATITQETGNPIVGQSIADALQLYEAFFGQITSAGLTSQSPYLVPVLTGLANGINDALIATSSALQSQGYKPVPATVRK